VRAGGAYPIGPQETDLIQVRVGTRNRLRQLGYDSYDAAIQALFRGWASTISLPPSNGDGSPPRAAKTAPRVIHAVARCPATKRIDGALRSCRIVAEHHVHRWWSRTVPEVSWP
jgi:hypothetical protein